MDPRFFCPDPPVDGIIHLIGDEAHHLSRVRRLARGERVVVFDGSGTATAAMVAHAGRDRVALRVVGGPVPDPPLARQVTLATAVPKGERFDWLIEKATEVGVARLRPVLFDRSVVDPSVAKIDRLRRRIVEACKQSGRNRLMTLDPPRRWSEIEGTLVDGEAVVALPEGPCWPDWPPRTRRGSPTLVIGPEGGFTAEEREGFARRGWPPIGFGANVLRTETAGLAGSLLILTLSEGTSP